MIKFQVENDMKAMRQENIFVLEEMEKTFLTREVETQQYFASYIEKLTKAAEERDKEHKKMVADLTEGAEKYKETATSTVNVRAPSWFFSFMFDSCPAVDGEAENCGICCHVTSRKVERRNRKTTAGRGSAERRSC